MSQNKPDHDDHEDDRKRRAKAHDEAMAHGPAPAGKVVLEDDKAAKAPAPQGQPVVESPEVKAARANESVGAQVVLDPASDAALAARGGAGASIEENIGIRNAATPRIIGLSHDTVGGTVTGKQDHPQLHRPVPWVEPPGNAKAAEDVRKEAVAQIVSP